MDSVNQRHYSPTQRASIVLSDLFIDTEHDDLALAVIAERLLDTGLDVTTLERILKDDVAPVCVNRAPIGVWPAFDPDWLLAEIERRQHGMRAWLPDRLKTWLNSSAAAQSAHDWARVSAHLKNPHALQQTLQTLRRAAPSKDGRME